jgi:hypothetical protein
LASDQIVLSIAGTDLEMSMPGDWYEISQTDLGQQLEQPFVDSGPIAELTRRVREDFDKGRIRASAGGPSGFEPWTETLIIFLYEGDGSLDERVAAVEELDELMTPSASERRDVELSIGEAIRLDYTYPVPDGLGPGAVPSHTVQYVVWLGDGRSLWVFATGPAAAEEFGALVDSMVATLKTK